MKKFILIVFLFILIGCSPLVCRHTVMADAAWAEEQHLNYKIVVYEVSPLLSLGIWNAHVQLKTERGWLSGGTFSSKPTYTMTGWSHEYTYSEYMRLMKRNCFNNADCKSEGIP